MRVTCGIWLKERISIADSMRVAYYADLASAARRWWVKVMYLRKAMGALTHRAFFAWLWDLLFFPQVLELSGLKPAEKIQSLDFGSTKRKLTSLCSSIAAKTGGKVPYEIMTGMTSEELDVFYAHLIIENLESARAILYAHHSPAEFAKEIDSNVKKLREKVRELELFRNTDSDYGEEIYESISPKALMAAAVI